MNCIASDVDPANGNGSKSDAPSKTTTVTGRVGASSALETDVKIEMGDEQQSSQQREASRFKSEEPALEAEPGCSVQRRVSSDALDAGNQASLEEEERSAGQGSDEFVQPENVESENAPPLSKKARKKLARQAHYQEVKLERRAKEKERKKEKKRLAKAETTRKREAGEAVSEDEQPRKRAKTIPSEPFRARVVVDLGFDDMMTDKEIISLTSQLAYTYSANRKATQPFSCLIFSSFNGRTRDRLERQSNAAHRRWTSTEWWDGGYEGLWDSTTSASATSVSEQKCEKEKVIYLTADAEDELSELREDEIYVLGGIVDHNRYKSLCLEKARRQTIRSARLPIGKYLADMTTRKVLTVNQVFEILIKWVETRDWSEALYSVVPKRKFQSNQVGSTGLANEGIEDGEENTENLKLEPDEDRPLDSSLA